MSSCPAAFRPPFCPRPGCVHHHDPTGWRFKRIGFYPRAFPPRRVQRYLCLTCRVSFSFQTFHTTYYLKRPDLLSTIFHRSLACSAYRQIARELRVSPSTVMRHCERLGRHCLLFQQQYRDIAPVNEPLVADGFESFEYSQYHPCHFHLVVGKESHFIHAFTDSELRRKGRMTKAQKRRREQLEREFGRPDPKSIEKEMAEALRLLPGTGPLELHTDEHPAYRRALKRLRRKVRHVVTSSKLPRTAGNPLFPVNLADLLIRHCGANHKRETIAFSKRRQGAAERLAIFQVWRNFVKAFSERHGGGTPAERLGMAKRALRVEEVLEKRLFLTRVGLPERLLRYYRRETRTRRIPRGRTHRLIYAD
jgi:transposase-like protein